MKITDEQWDKIVGDIREAHEVTDIPEGAKTYAELKELTGLGETVLRKMLKDKTKWKRARLGTKLYYWPLTTNNTP